MINDIYTENKIVIDFHRLFYDSSSRTWENTKWFGVNLLKNPLDLWIYQEIIFEIKPDIIIETGTYQGGSALFLANMIDLVQLNKGKLSSGKVITIDTIILPRPSHPRIVYVTGDSKSDDISLYIKSIIKPDDKVLVILDSCHDKSHVLRELLIYSNFVSLGSYIIVEDTNIHGHPIGIDYSEGPMEAIEQFLQTTTDFAPDTSKEKYFLTFSPRGYLLRIH